MRPATSSAATTLSAASIGTQTTKTLTAASG
jgi:hypothetical protein